MEIYDSETVDQQLSYTEFADFIQHLWASDIPWPEFVIPDPAITDEEIREEFDSCQNPEDEFANPDYLSLAELDTSDCYYYLCYWTCTGDDSPREIDSSELEENCECWTKSPEQVLEIYNYDPYDGHLSFWEFTHFLQDLMDGDTPWPASDEGDDETTPDEEASREIDPQEAWGTCQQDPASAGPDSVFVSLAELEADGCYWHYCYYSCTGDALPGTKDEVDSEELRQSCHCWNQRPCEVIKMYDSATQNAVMDDREFTAFITDLNAGEIQWLEYGECYAPPQEEAFTDEQVLDAFEFCQAPEIDSNPDYITLAELDQGVCY